MKRITLISLILGTVLAVAPAAQAMVASDDGGSSTSSSPTLTSGMSQAEYRAAMLRGEALNQKYGASTGLSQAEYRALKLRGEALNQKYGASTGLSQAEYRALKLRGEALNEQYGTSSTVTPEVTDGWTNSISPSTTFRPDILGGNGGVSTATPTATGGDSFARGTVGIGAATLVGVMLLGLASLAVTRRRHVPTF